MYILIEDKFSLEYIKDMLSSFKTKNIEVNNAKFHHNTSYKTTPLILKHGILSLKEINKLGLKKYSRDFLEKMSNTDSHINGIEGISLSIVGLKDLDPKKFEYNPYNSSLVDLIISSDVKARRSTHNYDNEFICFDSIANDKIKAVDVRLINLIEQSKNIDSIKDIIEKYNLLRDIALTIKELNLDIPLRDMSRENLTMDIDKVSNAPKLIIK